MTDPEQWPRWAIEPVRVVDHDPRWAAHGADLAERLDRLLARWLTDPTEHVGSTAVPGLAAKPILDCQAAVAADTSTEEIDAVLAVEGWRLVPPELDRRPWRRFWVLAAGDRRIAHLHLMVRGDRHRHDQLVFRDALRADAGLVADYARIKRRLAVLHPHDREAYTRGKAAFVRRVLDAARGS